MLIRLTAAAIVQNDDSKFLLIEERAQGAIVLNNPSGRWEIGESLAETSAREAAEEAGVLFTPTYFLGSFFTLHTSQSGQRVCTVRFAFGGSISPGEPATARDPEIIGVHWLSYEQIIESRSRHRSSAVIRCIENFRAGYRYPLNVVNHMVDS